MKNETLKAWYQASRPPFFVATLVPLTLGASVAATEGDWSALRWALALIASFFVHLATNLANDYFEYETGADSGESIGGSRVLQEGKITPQQVFNATVGLYAASLFIGLWVAHASGVWLLIPLMLFAFLSSLFYTAPPIRYGYRGLGELMVGLNMGPIMVAGCAAAVSGHFSCRAFWLSIPVGLMVALILYYQSLSDIEEDKAVGKLTLAARLGREGAVKGYRFFVVSALAWIVLLVAVGALSGFALLCLVAIIPAYRVDRMIRRTEDWKDLHDRGGAVRFFYLANGVIMIVSVLAFG